MRAQSTRIGTAGLQLALASVALHVTLACGSGASRLDDARGCASSCETNDWGRLIVGVVNLADVSLTPLVRVVDSTGFESPTDPQNCHDIPPPYVCTYEQSFGSDAKSATIIVEWGAFEEVTSVNLSQFNYCGRDIAYVEIWISAALPPRFSDVQYISPCQLTEL